MGMLGLGLFALTVPLFNWLMPRAITEGNFLANLMFIILVGISGLVLMTIAWHFLFTND
ncbi:MAG: hypothetical protein AB1814_08695 [Thermodesulfobacteriota bacterium]